MSRTNLRALGILLGLAASLLVCALALSCHSNDGAAPGRGPASSTIVPIPYHDGSIVSVQDLDNQTGFQFVLPSYIPETMSGGYLGSRGDVAAVDPRYAPVSVLFHSRDDSPTDEQIEIDEQRRKPNEPDRGLPSYEVVEIGQLGVHCVLEPAIYVETPQPVPTNSPSPTLDPEEARHPQFRCLWDTAELYYEVDFRWTLSQSLPGLITSDMHDEAMKVVASMIEDPYIP